MVPRSWAGFQTADLGSQLLVNFFPMMSELGKHVVCVGGGARGLTCASRSEFKSAHDVSIENNRIRCLDITLLLRDIDALRAGWRRIVRRMSGVGLIASLDLGDGFLAVVRCPALYFASGLLLFAWCNSHQTLILILIRIALLFLKVPLIGWHWAQVHS